MPNGDRSFIPAEPSAFCLAEGCLLEKNESQVSGCLFAHRSPLDLSNFVRTAELHATHHFAKCSISRASLERPGWDSL